MGKSSKVMLWVSGLIPCKYFFFENNYLDPPKKPGIWLIRVDWRLSGIYIYFFLQNLTFIYIKIKIT